MKQLCQLKYVTNNINRPCSDSFLRELPGNFVCGTYVNMASKLARRVELQLIEQKRVRVGLLVALAPSLSCFSVLAFQKNRTFCDRRHSGKRLHSLRTQNTSIMIKMTALAKKTSCFVRSRTGTTCKKMLEIYVPGKI